MDLKPYPFDTRHPDATAGILPPETRQLLLSDGWIHESEVDAMTGTIHTGRRRWAIPYAMIGGHRYYQLTDVLERLRNSYESSRQAACEKTAEDIKARRAMA